MDIWGDTLKCHTYGFNFTLITENGILNEPRHIIPDFAGTCALENGGNPFPVVSERWSVNTRWGCLHQLSSPASCRKSDVMLLSLSVLYVSIWLIMSVTAVERRLTDASLDTGGRWRTCKWQISWGGSEGISLWPVTFLHNFSRRSV